MDVTQVLADLVAEQDDLDAIVSGLADADFSLATASPRWSVADQIAHLAYFDATAAIAITDPERFAGYVEQLVVSGIDSDVGVDDMTLGSYREMSPPELLHSWRSARSALAGAGTMLENDTRVTWYGPSMGSKSFLTARLMECWAHGQDVVDTIGVGREPTDRLQHIARLGFITRGWSYANRGLDAPTSELSLTLEAPSGETWIIGADDAPESVTGTALDFCLVVVQRRHLDDTSLVASPGAREWLLIAQAFAGPPTDGPPPTR